MDKKVIHVDMDAFYASVEIRDNADLAGKPLIIGALPDERGVVSTCSYEARAFGIHSAMSIKEAYRRCPQGIYMHPNMRKYHQASDRIHKIWSDYTDLIEYVSLDEGYLDVTGSEHLFGGADQIGWEIKRRVREEIGITCSVGIGYSMMSAKLGSEEKKPDGFFAIPDAPALKRLIYNRDVRILMGVGKKTAEALHHAGLYKVRDLYRNRPLVLSLLGSHGKQILALADGQDERSVTPCAERKSIGKEQTFQEDTLDMTYIKDTLLLIAKALSFEIHEQDLFCCTITLKITYGNMQQITRSKTGEPTNRADEIYHVAAGLLDAISKKPIRLAGISLSGLTKDSARQLSLMDGAEKLVQQERLDSVTFQLQKKYGLDAIRTATELKAKKRQAHHP